MLHNLNEPRAGLEALVSVLAHDGGLGVMLYGEFGRTGVYPMQEMMRSLAPDQPPAARVEMTKRLLKQLPGTNWVRRNPFIADHLEQGDAGLFDLFLHARDRAYRVPEIAEMLEAAELRLAAFIEPALYDPASYLSDPALLNPSKTRLGSSGAHSRSCWRETCGSIFSMRSRNRTPVTVSRYTGSPDGPQFCATWTALRSPVTSNPDRR